MSAKPNSTTLCPEDSPDSFAESARIVFLNLVSLALLVGPAYAMWHPATLSGGLHNVLVFWSVFYVIVGQVFNCVLCKMVFDADVHVEKDEAMLRKVFKATKWGLLRILGLLSGLAWAMGAAYRSWFWLAFLLIVGWFLGQLLVQMARLRAEQLLKELDVGEAES